MKLGATVTFTAATVGAASVLYQWQKDGVILTGATNPSLSLPSVDYTNAGKYRVGATNSSGGVLSPVATLVVVPPASVTNLTYRISGTAPDLRLELIWPSGTLYSADDVTGPWTVVTNATVPYFQVLITPTTASKFFCVR